MPIVSMSVNDQILKKFDGALTSRGYSTRSEAFRDALRTFIDENEWSMDDGINAAVLTLIYDNRKIARGQISMLQHKFEEIQTVLHMHIDEMNCLEIFVVKGSSKRIKEIVKQIRDIVGIKEIKFVTATCDI